MTAAGWIFMSVFWASILATAAWCLRIVLTEKGGKGGGGTGAS